MPPEIGQFTSLTYFGLSNNQLSSLPPEIGQLTLLSILDLTANQLETLPSSLNDCTKLTRLFLHRNPKLKLSRAVLGATWNEDSSKYTTAQSILDVYFGRTKIGAKPLNEVKLLLVGRGNAGKTSTVRALLGQPFNNTEESTTGIALCDWTMPAGKNEPVTAHIWDFAGQVITHALHQFFFSERSVYVLVLSGRDNHENDDAQYWLRLITAFGQDEQGNAPPVIIALNKWDLPGCRPKVDQAALQESYPCIKAFIEMDCKTNKGVAKLKTTLCREVNRLQWVREPFPANWDKARRALAPKRNKQPHLSYAQFRTLCTQQGVEDAGQQDSLADILHNLGLAINYRRDPRLREATVLQPEWLTKNVYALMRRAEKQAGVLKQTDVDSVLRYEKAPRMRKYLMQIMERFEIAYTRRSPQGIWLLPQALPDQQPPSVAPLAATKDATRLRYCYTTLPEGLLARAIVRLHELIEVTDGIEQQWAKGVVLCRLDARALIRNHPQDRQIMITVTGPIKARQQLAGLCQTEMRDIHKEIPGLNPVEETLVQGTWVKTATLEQDEKRQNKTGIDISGQGTVMIDPIPENNAYSEKIAREDSWKPVVFISYSKSNISERKQLETQLKILMKEGLVSRVWHDRMIDPGDEWDNTIQRELTEADIIIILVSNDALATDYITEHEIPKAMALHHAKKSIVIPIILEACRWEQTALGKLNALPEKAKPLNTWALASEAVNCIGNGLAKVFEKRIAAQQNYY